VTTVTLSLKPTPYDQIAPDVQERSDACVLFDFFASAFILRSELSGTSGTEIRHYRVVSKPDVLSLTDNSERSAKNRKHGS
jgi:hypothetical protein